MLIPPHKSPWLEKWFHHYIRRYLQRSFHCIHGIGMPPLPEGDGRTPLIVCLNHSSWWDVLLGFYAGREWLPWESYGVMDALQLKRYRLFTRLGMIGVDRTRLSGAKEFVDFTERLLRGQHRALWVTPQGEMVSNQRRPIRFQPGLGLLAERLGDFYITTIVLHYAFWNERLPEAFISFSPLTHIQTTGNDFHRKTFLASQERAMEAQLDALLHLVERRDSRAFQPLLRGKSGISPTYDAFRALTARLRGEPFTVEHGDQSTPRWRDR